MGIILTAVLLYILISEFGEISASDHRWKILVLVIAAVVLEQAVGYVAGNWLVGILGMAVITVALAGPMMLWLKMARNAALKVAGLFFVIRIALGIALLWLFQSMARS